MRKLLRAIRRRGQDSDAWPVALLLLAVLVPAVCLLWFMLVAMRNERFAVRQKWADLSLTQLTIAQSRLRQHWSETAARLEELAAATPSSAGFARCVQSGLADSVVLFNEAGGILYPDAPSPHAADFGEAGAPWQEAGRLEHVGKTAEAAKRYELLARETTNDYAAARMFQSAARCLVQAGQIDVAVRLIDEAFRDERFRSVTDPRGRLIAANVEWMAIDLSTNLATPLMQELAGRLVARLNDYENPGLASPQRRFLMGEVERRNASGVTFATLKAERWAAEFASQPLAMAGGSGLQRGAGPDLWQLTTAHRRAVALFHSTTVLRLSQSALAIDPALADAQVGLFPPDQEAVDAFVTLPAGDPMPGWSLALSLKDRQFFETTAGRQTAAYLWTAVWVVSGMTVLTLLAVRVVRRRMTLARLKNDLAATVSHELKTPLSSMRVLVETLLEANSFDEQKTREYLQLIAQENERLGRLIQNFLAFSRMERRKYAFHFESVPAPQIVTTAVEAVRGRFDVPGCRLEVQLEANLPPVQADAGALSAAIINLLENAFKYSEDIKHIIVRARRHEGDVLFSVADNGIGIAPRERRRIFQAFYQVDQRLCRQGSGCGLGLSIVRFIADAHRGSISVESRPGAGSTFTLSVPIDSGAGSLRKEAIA